jgi:SAM-dependent methyltransferase
MDDEEIRRSAALERRHWWYAARRGMVRRLMDGVAPGRAVDVGPGSGGNSSVLRDLGWQVVPVEMSETAARLTHGRGGLAVVRGDARRLPVRDQSVDLVMSTDVWEHVEEDDEVAREAFRILRPGGRLLLAVPAGMAMWSNHDVALGHVRRYERPALEALLTGTGFVIHDVRSWNVLLRPVARLRRGNDGASESDMQPIPAPVNAGLRAAVELERFLPVRALPGLSLVVRASRPATP